MGLSKAEQSNKVPFRQQKKLKETLSFQYDPGGQEGSTETSFP